MQEEASIKSVFPAKENYISGCMGPVTIAGKNYDVWKVKILYIKMRHLKFNF